MKTSTWLNSRERGTLLGIRLTHWFATVLGRGPTRLLVRVVALWYVLFRAEVVEASKSWLQTVLQRPPRFSEVYGHVLTFAQVTVDRMFFLRGHTKGLKITSTGHEHLTQALAEGRGAILLGAHLGSFEALRASGQAEFPLQILGNFANAKMVNSLFEQINPEAAARVIHISTDSVDFIFSVQQCISEGGFVGTLGDRVGPTDKSVQVEFFGRSAKFSTGPLALAAVLKCPVFLTFALYSGPNQYDCYCEPFADRVVLPRRDRRVQLENWVQRYAQRLEHYCRKSPNNWFNFYDFWASQPPRQPAVAKGAASQERSEKPG